MIMYLSKGLENRVMFQQEQNRDATVFSGYIFGMSLIRKGHTPAVPG
jgi:hypothetical protein